MWKGRFASAVRDLLRKSHLGIGDRGLHRPSMAAQAPAEEAEANDNRPEAEHLPDAGKKLAIVTAASSITSRELRGAVRLSAISLRSRGAVASKAVAALR